ncbi:MAG: hypothetical protein HY884_04525 [Deltaproteobacteria bacterium]|nr:hypothetical protein [Deltaproteobacteria bacterium]
MKEGSFLKNIYLLAAMFILAQVNIFTVLPDDLYASTEVLKTSKVKVGEKAPLEGSIKDAHVAGKAVVLLLLSNPMQCRSCDLVEGVIKEAVSRGGGTVYVVKGGQDMLGAADEETVTLKRLFGFVTMGEAWTFVIDKNGILKKIFIGEFTKDELETTLDAMEK